jgi:hypothetical protein
LELPWTLGPPDGRYLVRRRGDPPDAEPAHVLVFAALTARQRPRVARVRRQHKARAEPQPVPVETTRATIVEVGEPFAAVDQAAAWLRGAGETDLEEGLAVLNRALHAYRLATADPHLHAVNRADALVARLGYGAGEEVAEGLWTNARELPETGRRRRRRKMVPGHARLAAILTGRQPALASEELALRARLDLNEGRDREAALQTLVALDAALAELPRDPAAPALRDRLAELRALREGAAAAARAALAGSIATADRDAAAHALVRLEAALRARAAALAD